jgi:hypothetical protein
VRFRDLQIPRVAATVTVLGDVAVADGQLALLSGFRLSPIFPIGLKPLIDTIGPKEPWDTRPPVVARKTEWLRRG